MKTKPFTPYERNSLIVEILMQEDPDREKVFALFQQLLKEKAFLLEAIVNSDNKIRQSIWPQFDKVKMDLQSIEDYINQLTQQEA